MLDGRTHARLLCIGLIAFFVAIFAPMPIAAQEQETPTPLPAPLETTPTPPTQEDKTQINKAHLPLIHSNGDNRPVVELQLPPDNPEKGMIYS